MKHELALNLTHEGLALLVNTGDGWPVLGEAWFDSSDFADQLAQLRASAQLVGGNDFVTRLVLPNSQVLYSSTASESKGEADDDARVRASLEGATPYAVKDLAYDWIAEGSQLQIAVVARETLQEAENFARDHGFKPVAFVAIPEKGAFLGEPFFGETELAQDLLPDEKMPQRAEHPIRIGPLLSAADVLALTAPAQTETTAQVASPTPPAPPKEDNEAEPVPAFSSIRSRREPVVSAVSPRATPNLDKVAAPVGPANKITPRITPGLPAPAKAEPAPPEPATAAGGVARLLGAVANVTQKLEARRAKPEKPTPAPASTAAISEAESLTVFGARNKPARSGGPGMGLILTLVLLALLLAVGLWSSLFLKDTVSGLLSDTETTEQLGLNAPSFAPDGALPDGLTTAEPVVPMRPVAPPGDTELANLTPAPDAAIPLAPTPPTLSHEELSDAEPEPTPLTPQEAAASYAATGVWQSAPDRSYSPSEDSLDDLYVASIDPKVGSSDAIDLPRDLLRNLDEPINRPRNPPAPGASVVLDAQGLVIPSPNGTLSPDGILVFAGRPAKVPPPRPALAIQASALVDDPLKDARPKVRPSDLVEQSEKVNLGGKTRSELSGIIPKPRPASVVAAAQALLAAQESAQKALAEAKAAEEEQLRQKAEAEAEANRQAAGQVSALAIAASRLPKERPRGLERRTARAADQNRDTATPQRNDSNAGNPSTASASPAALAVPRNQRLKPSAPTPETVATQATMRNAINLGRLNLIGVYGSPNSRRALIRLSSGRYVKVQVGDKVDGGRVSAIGESELRYNKGGRDVVLKMPSS